MQKSNTSSPRAHSVLILLALALLIAGPAWFKNNAARFGLYSCNGRMMTLEQVAELRGIDPATLQDIHLKRSLSVEDVCVMPQAKLDRAIFRASNPKPDHPGEAVEFRKLQLRDENGNIPADGLVRASEQVQAMLTAQAKSLDSNAAGIGSGAWTWLGPGNVGGRVRAILIHPANPNILWAGSVSGGIWKSTDGGASWQILTDFLGNMAVSTLALDPTDPNVLYAGTGEGFYNGDGLRGAGVFKSTDGGATWAQLSATNNSNWYYVNRLAVSSDGTTLLAATGSGIWRSTDRGASWTRTFSGGDVLDVNFNPSDNTKAIASGFSGSTLYSTNNGQTWSNASGWGALAWDGRVEVAYAPSSPSIVYASVNRNYGEVWKSADGGQTYTLVNTGSNYLGSQGWYDNIIWVDPTNPNLLVVGGIDLWRSSNGGSTLGKISQWYSAPNSAHADHHMVIEDPGYDGVSNKRVYFGNDGGVYRVNDVTQVMQLAGWVELNNNLGITQFYGAAGNPSTGEIIGGTQDNGTLFYKPASGSEGWTAPFGGDGGFSAADPSNPNYFYGEYVFLNIHRSSNRGISSDYIIGQYWNGSSWAWKNAPYRIDDAMNSSANFIAPFILDPNNPNRLLAGGLSLWRTNDVKTANTVSTGPSWAAIKGPIGAATYDNYISAIAVAKGNSDVIWVGHNNGSIYKTVNGTSASPTWTQVDANSPGLPNRYATRIAIDANDSNKVYVTFGGFSADNVWRTTNGGSTWTDVTGSGLTGLPSLPVRSLVIHPYNSNWLYVGTELGIFASEDGGANWAVPHEGPTNTSVDELFWMNSELVAATHGRGLFSIETLPCFTLTTTANPLAGGSIQASPAPNCASDPAKYSQGTVVTLTASANAGYTFSAWGGDAGGAASPVNVTMSADRSVTANFNQVCYALTVDSNPPAGGAVNVVTAPNCAADPAKYTPGTIVTLIANPASGYSFSNWSGDASGAASSVGVTMDADRSVTANFSQVCYTLTVDSNPSAGGSVGVSPAPNCNGGTQYTPGTTVTLTASANAGYVFTAWSGDASGAAPSVDVVMALDRAVTANFGPLCYTLTASPNPAGGGTVNASPAPNCNGGTQYTPGTTVTLTASANAGYVFTAWSGDASGTASSVDVVMSAHRNVTANFDATCYALTVSPSPAGGGTVNASPAPNCAGAPGKYTAGTLVRLTANANPGYAFSSWSGDASGAANPLDVTMSADRSLTANFDATCFSLTVNPSPAGSGTVNASPAPNCAGVPSKYSMGTLITLTASANAGYAFSSWSGSLNSAANPASFTIAADSSVTANFDASCFSLSVNASPTAGGTVNVSPAPNCAADPSKYAHGAVVTLTANPNTGYTFTAWGGSASGSANPTSVTMTADRSVTASFSQLCYTLTKTSNPTAGGTVSASPAPNCNSGTQYTYGSMVTLTASANAGYVFTAWSGDAGGSLNPVSLSMLANRSVTASFASTTVPVVTGMLRMDPSLTSVVRVKFTVNFSEPVTGVDTRDFSLYAHGLTEAFVGSISGSGQTYTVTVNTGAGNGMLRLDVVDNDSILDANGTPLGGPGAGNGNYTGGPSYTIVKGATYQDVPFTHWAWQYVERLHSAGVSGGCYANPPYFCPDAGVTRDQLAVFLLRAKYGAEYTPPAATGGVYTDVPKTHWAAAWIEQLSREGISGGCGAAKFCPATVVTRDQMAVFLLRAKYGAAYKPPAATGIFSDVPASHWAAAWIEQLAREGVTGGCGGGNYCPSAAVTRAQMAVFIVKAFDLP